MSYPFTPEEMMHLLAIRDIPYRLQTEVDGVFDTCLNKHQKAKVYLESRGYAVRWREGNSLWSLMALPPQVAKIAHDDAFSHVWLEVNVGDVWLPLDITWDAAIASCLPVNDLDDSEATQIAVPITDYVPLEHVKIYDVLPEGLLEEERRDLERNGNFYIAFNGWLESLRKVM